MLPSRKPTIEPNEHVEHGVRYSLTLHDANNTRVAGFDNAHAVQIPRRRKKYGARKTARDHKHKLERVFPYEFESPGQLLEDFWTEIDKVLGE